MSERVSLYVDVYNLIKSLEARVDIERALERDY